MEANNPQGGSSQQEGTSQTQEQRGAGINGNQPHNDQSILTDKQLTFLKENGFIIKETNEGRGLYSHIIVYDPNGTASRGYIDPNTNEPYTEGHQPYATNLAKALETQNALAKSKYDRWEENRENDNSSFVNLLLSGMSAKDYKYAENVSALFKTTEEEDLDMNGYRNNSDLRRALKNLPGSPSSDWSPKTQQYYSRSPSPILDQATRQRSPILDQVAREREKSRVPEQESRRSVSSSPPLSLGEPINKRELSDSPEPDDSNKK